ncbi:hypothetical protein SCLCIDRAFT_135274 [Scleroderma citrinum Foug A]|uniref:Major facilitator superfamily (MFS) profile domain-containing protein n=1 Tax=Scleroderma citrinum Foug A TaxID=1036808 RepID=A0A0C2ZRD9_9AGAM|nr:hypothetical protein SCLCIDRAFT_135274 [Scleroderma citrinum Foug A]
MSSSQDFHTSHQRGNGGNAESLQAPTDISVDSLDAVYRAKAKILDDAFQEIGMGRYQWRLFVMAGLGWFSDSISSICNPLILTSVTREFNVQGEWMLLAQALGLLVGVIFWGVGCDLWGRRWSFNLTLLIMAFFTLTAAAAPNYTTLCACISAWSLGMGGNVPVDSTIFIEFIPLSHQYLLTVLAIWWSLGDLISTLIAWPLISSFSCPPAPASCPTSSNRGWRYLLLVFGGIMLIIWIVRFFVFNLQESPKYLMDCGRDEEAVAVVHRVASINGKTSGLKVEHLKEAEKRGGPVQKDTRMVTSTGAMKRISTFHANHVRVLFSTRTLAYSMGILVVSWALIGLTFPLFCTFQTYYLQIRGVENGRLSDTYRNQVISYFLSVPAALMAGYLIEVPILGRRRTLAIFTVLTGVFIFLSTTARTTNAYDGWNYGVNYASTVMYAVLFNLSSELFPTKARGTGLSMVFAANYVFSALTPIITLHTGINSPVPIWVAGGMLVSTGFIMLLVPIEPQGRGSVEIYGPE